MLDSEPTLLNARTRDCSAQCRLKLVDGKIIFVVVTCRHIFNYPSRWLTEGRGPNAPSHPHPYTTPVGALPWPPPTFSHFNHCWWHRALEMADPRISVRGWTWEPKRRKGSTTECGCGVSPQFSQSLCANRYIWTRWLFSKWLFCTQTLLYNSCLGLVCIQLIPFWIWYCRRAVFLQSPI